MEMESFYTECSYCGKAYWEKNVYEKHLEKKHFMADLNKLNVIKSNIIQESLSDTNIRRIDEKIRKEIFNNEQQIITLENLLCIEEVKNPEDIELLIIRNCNLKHFTLEEKLHSNLLLNLKLLSLSNNQIEFINDIEFLTGLIELNISNNKIKDINPLQNCINLKRLWASNNLINEISALVECNELKYLSLNHNLIENWDKALQSLKQISKLKSLEIQDNPICSTQSYSEYLICNLKLKKLDNELITPERIMSAKDYISIINSSTIIRPNTVSNYRTRHISCVPSLQNALEFSSKNFNNIEENSEEFNKLNIEFQLLTTENEKFKKELQKYGHIIREQKWKASCDPTFKELQEENSKLILKLSSLEQNYLSSTNQESSVKTKMNIDSNEIFDTELYKLITNNASETQKLRQEISNLLGIEAQINSSSSTNLSNEISTNKSLRSEQDVSSAKKKVKLKK